MQAFMQINRHWFVSENSWTLNGEHATALESATAVTHALNFAIKEAKDSVTEIRIVVMKG